MTTLTRPIRLAISGAFHMLLLLAAIALTASEDGAHTIADAFNIDPKAADTYLKAGVILLLLGLVDYFEDVSRLYGPAWLNYTMSAVTTAIAHLGVMVCGVVLAFLADDVATATGNREHTIRVIAAAAGALYFMGITFSWISLLRSAVRKAVSNNNDWWNDEVYRQEEQINLSLANAGIDQDGAEGVRVLVDEIQNILDAANVHDSGVAGVAELARRAAVADRSGKSADAVPAP